MVIYSACQESGILAWDCINQDLTLVIPSVLAMVGDNPMQSEFACHGGLKCSFFCRACWVESKACKSAEGDNKQMAGDDSHSVASHSTQGSDDGSGFECSASPAPSTKGKGCQKKTKTMQEMVSHVTLFMQASWFILCRLSMANLTTVYSLAVLVTRPPLSRPWTSRRSLPWRWREPQTSRKIVVVLASRTSSRTFSSTSYVPSLSAKRWGKNKNSPRCASFVSTSCQTSSARSGVSKVGFMPFSDVQAHVPVSDFDPHSDTPVEVLHVMLLGFVWYFWRDAVACIDKDKIPLLVTRLNSANVSGLGIPPLTGKTLVQYAGSLVGRDFCALAQVACLS